MKKLFYLVAMCAAVAGFDSCKSKKMTAQTPALAAKEYAECFKNDKYETFVEAIVFEPAMTPVKPAEKKAHATALRTIHKPAVDEKGGVKDVAVVSEYISPDGKTANVVLTNTYNNGHVETVDYALVNDEKEWKIRVNDNKEVWKAVTNDGEREVLKVRDHHDRDFVKTKDGGDKAFVKELTRRDGQVEVIKTLENGDRHKEVIKTLDEGNREIDKFKDEDSKVVHKDKDEKDKEVIKDKDHEKGEKTVREKEVIEK